MKIRYICTLSCMDEDKYLIEDLRRGDEKAYKKLFLKYYSPLSEYASQFLSDSNAEEVVQDFMIFLWENRTQILITTSLKSFLFTSVKNRSLNAIRHNEFVQRLHNKIYEELENQFDDPDYYMANDLAEQIKKAIDALPDTYRETFRMSRFGHKSNAEIAEQQGISVKTVEGHITHSLKILRRSLSDYLYFLLIV